MTWLPRYHLRHFVATSFWFVPALAMMAAVPAMRLVLWLDTRTQWHWFGFSVDRLLVRTSGVRGIRSVMSDFN